MPRVSVKGRDNIFYQARINSKKSEYSSRLSASSELGINDQRLNNIEVNKIMPYPEEVLVMSESYNAPHLIEHFCNNICCIGRKFSGKFKSDTDNVYKSSIVFMESLKEASRAKDEIIEILKDGEITDDELEALDNAIKSLNQTMSDILNLRLALEKEKRKR